MAVTIERPRALRGGSVSSGALGGADRLAWIGVSARGGRGDTAIGRRARRGGGSPGAVVASVARIENEIFLGTWVRSLHRLSADLAMVAVIVHILRKLLQGHTYGPRVLACPDQLIDYTWGRISTLCEEPGTEVLHVDFGDPYTPSLRAEVIAAAKRAGVAVVDGGCYGATQGPRLETRAEIARMRRDGCDLVGMTGMPEAGLARELGLDYACLAIVANWAAGAGPDVDEVITLQDVLDNVAAAMDGVPRLLRAMLAG